MFDSPQHNSRATELDPDLLSTPFGAKCLIVLNTILEPQS
jgi:hypothetical protein